ncbi:type 1 glutamine amidotransferase [Pseudonocardia bannensis]|uniref:C26 family cysteine hydrolase domain-containing family n=1 Tax=Pseudonocardia bannensis TaxID=630973 RepID=A0A848DKB6_9PSEU|nr:gamma-glutamyl-gamma-aminobutyrate hydrolase family protein [Pseudonocardia bannensis]NMH93132.1 C26 family cysteine hydrolase domain-containing family [Pseudonocardia bannensis]
MIPLIVHSADTDTAWLEQILHERGAGPRVVRIDEGEPVPALDQVDGLVVLGGAMGAYETGRYPFLRDTMRSLEQAIEREVPALAICLGAQLLAEVTGGRAYPGHGREWGYIPVRLTDAGRADPVLGAFEGEHLSFHSDTFDPPPGCALLADSPDYPQAFRVGSALGLQFHPEMSSDGVRRLLAATHPGTNGHRSDVARILTDAIARDAAGRTVFRRLLERWAPRPPAPRE